jgi:hypothetical protein
MSKSTDTLGELVQSFRDEIDDQPGQATTWEWEEVRERHQRAQTKFIADLRAWRDAEVLAALEGVEGAGPPVPVEPDTDNNMYPSGFYDADGMWRKALELEKEKYRGKS